MPPIQCLVTLAIRAGLLLMSLLLATAGVLVVFTSSTAAASHVRLLLSSAPDRSNPVPLDRASATGNIYVFSDNPAGLDTVRFWVDDTTLSTSAARTDGGHPYDLAGGKKKRATPYDTRRLRDGTHTVSIEAIFADGTVDVTTASFAVRNVPAPTPAPTPTLTPGPATTPTITPTTTPTPALTSTPAPTRTVFGADSGRPFADTSPFNVPIGTTVRLDPNSTAIVAGLAGKGYATAQVYADTPSIYNADASTPRYIVNCTESWGTCDLERARVPIPPGATAASGFDANMVVVDWSTRKTYEFWQYRNDRGTASWGAVCSIDGSGTGNGSTSPCRAGAVGAGVSRLAGVIRTHEFRQGNVDHALVGPTPNSCKAYRYPAVKSDGWSTVANCVPEGARVQLDPAVNCGALNAPSWEKMVCRALQTYGWYNIDNGGRPGDPGFGIQFENPAGESDPYKTAGLSDYTAISHIPLTRLRVLESWNSFG